MSRLHTFRIHDDSVNTYGFRMLTAGANLEEYRKNPVVLYNHNDWEAPIGRAESVYIKDGAIYADILFDEEDPKAAEIAGKVERGFLRMASVGAWPPEEWSDDGELKLPGQTGGTAIRWTMREVSVCPIGANHNALALYDRNTGKRIDLADKEAVIGLMDGRNIHNNPKNKTDMSLLTQMLKLSDSASEQAVADEVSALIALRDKQKSEIASLQAENGTLRQRITVFEEKEKENNRNRAVALVDEAVKDGRIDASGREAWLKDLERDFDNTSVRLSSIARRGSIVAQVVPAGGNAGAVTLRDMTFRDILKADRLKELKADKELYRQKFREAYGHEPA